MRGDGMEANVIPSNLEELNPSSASSAVAHHTAVNMNMNMNVNVNATGSSSPLIPPPSLSRPLSPPSASSSSSQVLHHPPSLPLHPFSQQQQKQGKEGEEEEEEEDLNLFVSDLLDQMTGKFEHMGQSILGRIDDMGDRIDHLEHSISDLLHSQGLGEEAVVLQGVGGGDKKRSATATTTGSGGPITAMNAATTVADFPLLDPMGSTGAVAGGNFRTPTRPKEHETSVGKKKRAPNVR